MSNVTQRIGGARASLAFKAPVRCATTAAITLSGFQTIDGVTLADGDENLRVFVKNQTNTVENGIYVAQSGTWTRARDFDGNGDIVKGTRIYVANGTTNGDTGWVVDTADPIVIGTTGLSFTTPGDEAATAAAAAAASASAAAASAILAQSAASSFTWNWEASTSSGPSTGAVRFNHATFASVTSIYLSETDLNSANLAALIATWDDSTSTIKGTIICRESGSPTNYWVGNVTALTDNGSDVTLTVTHRSSGGSFSAADDISVMFIPNGDIGDDGIILPDISGLTEDTTPDGSADFLITYDTSASAQKKVKPNNIQFLQSGTGAVSRPWVTKLRELSVSPEDFGAVADGTTDDASALGAAIDAIIASGYGTLRLTPRTYRIKSRISKTISAQQHISIRGEARTQSVLDFSSNASLGIFFNSTSVTANQKPVFEFRDIGLITSRINAGTAIQVTYADANNIDPSILVKDVFIGQNVDRTSDSGSDYGYWSNGIIATNARNGEITNLHLLGEMDLATDSAIGISLLGESTAFVVTDSIIQEFTTGLSGAGTTEGIYFAQNDVVYCRYGFRHNISSGGEPQAEVVANSFNCSNVAVWLTNSLMSSVTSNAIFAAAELDSGTWPDFTGILVDGANSRMHTIANNRITKGAGRTGDNCTAINITTGRGYVLGGNEIFGLSGNNLTVGIAIQSGVSQTVIMDRSEQMEYCTTKISDAGTGTIKADLFVSGSYASDYSSLFGFYYGHLLSEGSKVFAARGTSGTPVTSGAAPIVGLLHTSDTTADGTQSHPAIYGATYKYSSVSSTRVQGGHFEAIDTAGGTTSFVEGMRSSGIVNAGTRGSAYGHVSLAQAVAGTNPDYVIAVEGDVNRDEGVDGRTIGSFDKNNVAAAFVATTLAASIDKPDVAFYVNEFNSVPFRTGFLVGAGSTDDTAFGNRAAVNFGLNLLHGTHATAAIALKNGDYVNFRNAAASAYGKIGMTGADSVGIFGHATSCAFVVGNSAGSSSLIVNSVASPTGHLEITDSPSAAPSIGAAGSATNIDITYVPKGSGIHKFTSSVQANNGVLSSRATGGGSGAVSVYDTTDGGWLVWSEDGTFRLSSANTSGSWTGNYVEMTSGGDFRVAAPGTNSASVVTVSSTQTLTNKTLTSPSLGGSNLAMGASSTEFGPAITGTNNVNDNNGPLWQFNKSVNGGVVSASTNLFWMQALGHDGTTMREASDIKFGVDAVAAGSVSGNIEFLTSNAGSIARRFILQANGNIGIGSSPSYGSGVGVIFIGNGTAPSGTPTGGGVLYVESGALKYKGSSGTVTTIAPA